MSADGDGSGEARTQRGGQPPSHSGDADEFDRRGWVLVGVIVLCFLVIPATILYRPPALPWEVALLVLPLLPAFVLGATAVWAALSGERA